MEEDGSVAASYKYDAWGRVMSHGGFNLTLASLNPFRYQGYVYDEETGLYYLRSRYYDPEMGRFINADGQLNPGAGLTGLNLFAYCENDPVNKVDSEGTLGLILTGVIIFAVAGGLLGGHVAGKRSVEKSGKINAKEVALGIAAGSLLGGMVNLLITEP